MRKAERFRESFHGWNANGQERPFALDAFEPMHAPVFEHELRSHDQVLHRPRNEDLSPRASAMIRAAR